MNKYAIIPLLSVVMLVVACKSGTNKTDEHEDSIAVVQNTDTMHHGMHTETIEGLPEIPAGARVFFKNLKNNQKVSSPLAVEMGAEGIAVDSAGRVRAASGHHHILVDVGDSITTGQVIKNDSIHLHFGNAQKKAELKLKPGLHRLTLQFADGLHRSYGSRLAKPITIEVKK